jgi:hypothetical protein
MEITSPVAVFDYAGLRIRGAHGIRPVLAVTGVIDTVLDFANCRDTLIENLSVTIEGTIGCLFHYWRKEKGKTTPTNNKHRGVACVVKTGAVLHRFASHDLVSDTGQSVGIDANNEFSLYEDIDIDGALIGICFVGQHSHGHVLSRCRFNAVGHAVIASGWFSATDVSGSGISLAAFYTHGISAPIHIVRPNFEATKRLLIAEGSEGFSGDTQAIVIQGGSTRCDQLHVDGAVIDIKHAGPLRVVGHQFGSGQQPVPHIRTWTPGVVTVMDCDVGSWDSYGKPFVRRPDGSEDTESVVRRTYLHAATGVPMKRADWWV